MQISVELKVSEKCCAVRINALIEGLPAFEASLLPKRSCTHVSILTKRLLIIPLFVSQHLSKLLMATILDIFVVPVFLGFISFCPDPFVPWPKLSGKSRIFRCIFEVCLSEGFEGEGVGHFEFTKGNIIDSEATFIFILHEAIIATDFMVISLVYVTLILQIFDDCLFLGDNLRKVGDLIRQKLKLHFIPLQVALRLA